MSEQTTEQVIVADEYLDGIMALSVQKPEAWDETVRELPSDVLRAYEAAWTALRDAESRLLVAWNAAPEIPNPKYKPMDGDGTQ